MFKCEEDLMQAQSYFWALEADGEWLSAAHFYLQKENRTLGKISGETHPDNGLLSSDALSPLTDVFL